MPDLARPGAAAHGHTLRPDNRCSRYGVLDLLTMPVRPQPQTEQPDRHDGHREKRIQDSRAHLIIMLSATPTVDGDDGRQ